jgi:hypothetical protein
LLRLKMGSSLHNSGFLLLIVVGRNRERYTRNIDLIN